ncbi:MAG: hypothetical protein EBZ50_11650, partial [Alphaproteobacteria bacterium]|nr:hypothetical protein [Alphaproteobacteria bacterium]
VGVPAEYLVEGLQSEVDSAIRESLSWMEKQGARLVPISLPHTQYSVAVYYLVAVSEASSNLARFDGVRYGYRPSDRPPDRAFAPAPGEPRHAPAAWRSAGRHRGYDPSRLRQQRKGIGGSSTWPMKLSTSARFPARRRRTTRW